MRARYYDPNAGRFLTRDTWAVNYNDPMELNRYGYVAGNPVNATDPSGNGLFESIKLRIMVISSKVLAGLLAVRDTLVDIFNRIWIKLYATWARLFESFRSAPEVVVNSGQQGGAAPMTVYRTIQYGERLDDILNEMKGLVFSNNVEYAIVRLADGTRAIVSGGFTGIQFAPGQITRLFLHIHPFGLPAQGPSPGDYQALYLFTYPWD